MTMKHQVFVSSTYLDLKDERQKVMQALLRLQCIPSGMELFPAANKAQWQLIKDVIDECDYYVMVIGGRYGSLGPGAKSYTQLEYEYAVKKKKPLIAFLHSDPASLPKEKKEETDEAQKKLDEFRNWVQKRQVDYWTTPDGLAAAMITSFLALRDGSPARGWVRGDSTGVSYDELAHLESQLRKITIEDRRPHKNRRIREPTALLRLVQKVVIGRDQYTLTIDQFMKEVVRHYGNDNVTNLVYWWLLVEGVFGFKGLSNWYSDNGIWWEKCIGSAELTERGTMLFHKLRKRHLDMVLASALKRANRNSG